MRATETADSVSAVPESMTDNNKQQPTFWRRYRMPIILGIIALCLYVGSIVWMVFGRGQVG